MGNDNDTRGFAFKCFAHSADRRFGNEAFVVQPDQSCSFAEGKHYVHNPVQEWKTSNHTYLLCEVLYTQKRCQFFMEEQKAVVRTAENSPILFHVVRTTSSPPSLVLRVWKPGHKSNVLCVDTVFVPSRCKPCEERKANQTILDLLKSQFETFEGKLESVVILQPFVVFQ